MGSWSEHKQFITFVAKWEKKYPILKKYKADRNVAYFTYMDFPVQVQRCIYTTNWIERLNRKYKRTIKNENINAIRQVGTFPTSKCCHGRNKNNIFKKKLSMQILETKGRKTNKIKREEREDLHTFSDTTKR